LAFLIVTRPADQADNLLQGLAALGHEVVHMPLMSIHPVADDNSALAQSARRCFLDLDYYQTVISISANATRLGLEWLDNYWPQAPLGIDWLAVGPASLAALRNAGLPACCPAERYDSEGVLALPLLQHVTGRKILIWRGVGGRETLAEVLRQRGARVDYAELYQRQACEYQPTDWLQALHNKPWLLLSSGQALDIVQQQVPDLVQRVSGLVLPSMRVAEIARQQGFEQVRVPASAGDEDTLACLDDLFA
jgi:uroporphyrinogen-III synthase